MNPRSRWLTQAPSINNAVADKQSNKGKGFLLRIEPEMMAEVERWAAQEFRSVNGQLQWIIADALRRYKRKTKD